MIIRLFSLSYSMEQLSAYGDGNQPTPNADLESGQVKTSSSSVSAPPDLSQEGDLAPPSSIPAGPTGPVTCHQDLPPPASLPDLAGSKDLLGFFLCPRIQRNRMMPSCSALGIPRRTLPRWFRSLPLRCPLRTL